MLYTDPHYDICVGGEFRRLSASAETDGASSGQTGGPAGGEKRREEQNHHDAGRRTAAFVRARRAELATGVRRRTRFRVGCRPVRPRFQLYDGQTVPGRQRRRVPYSGRKSEWRQNVFFLRHAFYSVA